MGIPKMQGQVTGKTTDEAGRANEYAGFEWLREAAEATDGGKFQVSKMRKNGWIRHKNGM
ncbi:MAG: hypothetical protein Q8O37_11485 [Sulfuricellaceae bacterium]|nr:hypothetical protein [Sulfuricellaceae bacterium]